MLTPLPKGMVEERDWKRRYRISYEEQIIKD